MRQGKDEESRGLGTVSVGIAGLKTPTEANVALSHVDGVSDSARARELYNVRTHSDLAGKYMV